MSPQRYQLSLDKKRLDQTISELIKLRTQFQNNKDYLETWPRFLINTNKQLQLLDERSMRFSQIFLSDQWKELFDWTFITEINGEQFDLLLIEIENLHRDAVQIQQMTPRNDESIQYIINQHVEYWHSKQDRMPDAGIESEHQAKRIRGLAEIQTNTNALVSAWEKFIAGYSNLPQAH